jgi:diguanylate cyclase (GGDEF)-like protein/PAS domain S-box-containing protein
VLALAALSISLGQANLRGAEQHRLDERSNLTKQIGSYVRQAYPPDKLRAAVDDTPFNASSPALNALLLQQFQVSPTGDPNVVVALFDRNGKQTAARPEKNDLTVGLLGDAWTKALAGQVGASQTFPFGGEVLRANALPVGAGTPWAVLVAVTRDESGQQFEQRLGGLGTKRGGFFSVDARGAVLTSWDPDHFRLGSVQLSEAELTALRATGYRKWFTGSGNDKAVHIGSYDPETGYTQAFTQRTTDLFADLRATQRIQDRLVLAVLVVALAGLLLLGWRRERTARRSAARVHALLKNAHDLVLVVAADSTTSFVSPAIEDLLGYDEAAWTGRPLLEMVHPDDAGRVAVMLRDAAQGRLLNVRLRAFDGTIRWFDVESSVLNADEDLSGILLTCHDVGERKGLQDQLTFQASHDELTGLANRAVFCERLEVVRDDALRHPENTFAVLFIDLDHFKPVNDTLGHDAGDQVLRTVAARLNASVRSKDLVCRFGGDEFGVLLPTTDQATACEVAQRMVRGVRAPIAVGASLVHIDASIGIALAGGSSLPGGAERLIREADEAMYLAKQAGRGRFAVYSSRTAGVALPRQSTEDAASVAAEPARVPVAHSRNAAFPRSIPAVASRSLRQRLAHLLPLLVAGALVVGIAAIGSVQEARAGAAAQAKRVAERTDITLRVGEYSAIVSNPKRLQPAVDNAPWALDNLAANSAILEAFSHSPAAGPNSIVAVTRLDGTVAASFPPSSPVNLPRTDPTWADARRGIPGFSALQEASTTPRAWYVLPIMKNGTPQALLLIGQSTRDAEISKLMQAVGSLGFGSGGLINIDRTGTVIVAWNSQLIGTQVLKPEDLAGLRLGDVRRFDRNGQTMLVSAAWPAGDPGRRYMVFSQSTRIFFEDLRQGQTTRNLLLFGLVCAAVLGLALLSRRRELAERRSSRRLQALLHNAHDLVVALDGTGRTIFVSSAIEGLLGHAPSDWADRHFLDLVDPEDHDRVEQALHDGWSEGEGDRVIADVRLRTIDGGARWFDVGVVDLRADPAVSGLLLTCHEIGERKQLQDELRHRAHHDVLTGLPNRATFAQHLSAITTDGVRSFAVLFIDLDHFKPVNDLYGHDAGDAVLQAVAGRIQAAVRSSSDRMEDLLSRLGGDEFAVVLGDVDDVEARRVADRVLAAIAEPIGVGGAEVVIGATIGIALNDPGALEELQPEAVVQRADSAMYEAKAAGRGRYAVFGS